MSDQNRQPPAHQEYAANNTNLRKFVDASTIRLDGATQPRCAINEDTVQEYAEAMRDGANFPPVVVFNDGSSRWLADGFHRFHATRAAGLPTILIDERAGTRRDAVLFGFQANIKHGLRETRADKRRKIEVMLRDAEWVCWSDREIARRCGVHHETVGTVRAELVGRGEIRHVDIRTDSAGRQQPAARAAASGEIRQIDDRAELAGRSEIPNVDTRTDDEGLPEQPATETVVGVTIAPPASDNPTKIVPDESRLYEEGSSVSAWVLAHQATHAIKQISKNAPNATAAIKGLQAVVARQCATIGMLVDDDVERLRAENTELREQLAELARNLEEAVEELEVLHRVTGSDDQIKAALDEARRVAEHNRILEERIRGLTGEKAEVVRLLKSWKRRAERAEAQLAARG